jgi:hypothetical protein
MRRYSFSIFIYLFAASYYCPLFLILNGTLKETLNLVNGGNALHRWE